MNEFFYEGPIAASKSMLNRALTLQSYAPSLKITGDSECEDVRRMKRGLRALALGQEEVPCGAGGTTFRFLALRASRWPGERYLRATSRLMQRPQQGLLKILDQLGVQYRVLEDGLYLHGREWPAVESVEVESRESSQFASALLLNAWELPFDLKILSHESMASEEYFQMTAAMVTGAGMQVETLGGRGWLVPKSQRVRATQLVMEPDVSSCFAVAACAALAGEARLHPFPEKSLQPDRVFVDIMKRMGIRIEQRGDGLSVQRTPKFHGVNVDLKNSPDLFPVLSVLAARAEGESVLSGLGNLVFKESDRLNNGKTLLSRLGRKFEERGDALVIHGSSEPFKAEGEFDSDQDHRVAMAVQAANFGGARLQLRDPEVVNKSFPEFWDIVGDPHGH